LSLHDIHGFFKVSSFPVDWAATDHHLLSLMTLAALEVLLVMHLLELLETEMLLLHHLIHLRRIVFGRLARWFIALRARLLWRRLDRKLWNWLLPINILRLDFKVFLLNLAISNCLIWIRSSENAVISLTVLIGSYERGILSNERIDTISIRLAIGNNLVWRNSLLLTLNIWIRVKLSYLTILDSSLNTTLIAKLVMHIWMAKTTSESRRDSSAWKIELLAKRGNMRQTSLAFLMALVKNTVRKFSNFWTDIPPLVLPWGLDGGGVVLMVLSCGAPVHCFFKSIELHHWRTVGLFNIVWWFFGVRCSDQMSWF